MSHEQIVPNCRRKLRQDRTPLGRPSSGDSPEGPARYISVATRATRFRRWLAQLLDYVLLHGPRLP